jgi:RluA family pseudouridine synthase
MFSWCVEEETSLLHFLSKKLAGDHSCKSIKRAIDARRAYVNGRIERFASRRIAVGDCIEFELSNFTETQTKKIILLYEDEHLLVIDKPSGWLCEEKCARRELGMVWMVHRLDKETSGVLLFAKSISAKNQLDLLFAQRAIKKEYLAIVHGAMLRSSGTIDFAIDKKSATTHWTSLQKGVGCSLLACRPHTGRKHQLRIHLARIGHPILGDMVYGTRKNEKYVRRLQLHARSLEFLHPVSQEVVCFTSPIPEDFSCGSAILNSRLRAEP